MQVGNSLDCCAKDNTEALNVSVILSEEDALLLDMAYFDSHASPLQPIIATPAKREPSYYGNHCILQHRDDKLFLVLRSHLIQRGLEANPVKAYSSG